MIPSIIALFFFFLISSQNNWNDVTFDHKITCLPYSYDRNVTEYRESSDT